MFVVVTALRTQAVALPFGTVHLQLARPPADALNYSSGHLIPGMARSPLE